jgi:hypothetical protein
MTEDPTWRMRALIAEAEVLRLGAVVRWLREENRMQNRKRYEDMSTNPYDEPMSQTTLWGALRFFWHKWHGLIIGGAIALAVMVGVLLLTYRLV